MTDAKRIIRDRRAAGCDASPGHDTATPEQDAAWRALLAGWAGDAPIDAVDAGCGTGFLALRLAALGHRVVGVDAAAAMLARAREKAPEVDLRLGDVEALPLPDASADLLVERHVLWTLPAPGVALRDWARVLRRGGRLILIEGQWDVDASSPSAAAYAPIAGALPLYGGRPADVVAALVTGAGYTDVVVEPLDQLSLWSTPPQGSHYAVLARRP